MLTKEQAAAFLFSQTACALAEIESMKAANFGCVLRGIPLTYGEAEFQSVPDHFGIGHNAAVTLLQSST